MTVKQTYTRTVVVYDRHPKVVASFSASKRDAKRFGWRPGVTHSKTVGDTRYVFHDGQS